MSGVISEISMCHL